MRDNKNAIYYVDMTAEEIHEHYEQMTLREAYQRKKVSLKAILASFWLYILTNALCFLLCGVTIITASLILVDCFAATQITISIMEIIQDLPLLFAAIGVVALAGLSYAVTIKTMRKELVLVEKEAALSV